MKTIFKAAVIQAAPVFFNKSKTLQKAVDLIQKAGDEGAGLAVFPEAFIPGYPRGLDFGVHLGNRTKAGRELWNRYYEESVALSEDLELLSESARTNKLYLSMGVIEKDNGTLYCTNILFGPDGRLLGKHRKLKPTAAERYIWGEGDGTTLTSYDTGIGKIGSLICWENYMPLARMAMYRKGVEIYLAPTADQREVWQSTVQHIALEGRCYVLSCNQYIEKSMIPEEILQYDKLEQSKELESRGGSVIISPMGNIIAGPLWDREGILYAEPDLKECVKGKFDFDVNGHYNRPDVFKFDVPDQPDILNVTKTK